jgi:hypothetical protein
MDLRRLGRGEWLLGIAGVALLVSLFLPWYEGSGGLGACTTQSCATAQLSAWEAMAIGDVLLALVAAFAVLVVIVTATQRVPALPLALDGFLTYSGLVATIAILWRAASIPGEASGRAWALWLGLAAVLCTTFGALVAMRDERLSRPGRTTDVTGVPVPPPTPLEVIPAPPAGGSA